MSKGPIVGVAVLVVLAAGIVIAVTLGGGGSTTGPEGPGAVNSVAIRPANPVEGELIRVVTKTVMTAGEPGKDPVMREELEITVEATVTRVDVDAGIYEAEAAVVHQRHLVQENGVITVEERPNEADVAAGTWPETKATIKGGREALSLATLVNEVDPGSSVPLRGIASLGRRKTVEVGSEESVEGPVALGAGVKVPTRKTFRVDKIEPQDDGSALITVTMKTKGVMSLGDIEYRMTGEGTTVTPSTGVDRPRSMKVLYNFLATGGGGADAERTTTIEVTTESVKR